LRLTQRQSAGGAKPLSRRPIARSNRLRRLSPAHAKGPQPAARAGRNGIRRSGGERQRRGEEERTGGPCGTIAPGGRCGTHRASVARRGGGAAGPSSSAEPGNLVRTGGVLGVRLFPQRQVIGVQEDRRAGTGGQAGCRVGWSLWAWVQTIALRVRPPRARVMASASWAASMTTASWSSPTIQALLSTSQVPSSSVNVPEVTSRSIRAPVMGRPRPSAARRPGACARRPSRPRPARWSP
jgi:hypothetical protein